VENQGHVFKAVDKQAKVLVEQWEKDEREQKAAMLAAKAQELFPQSTVVPVPDAPVPSVMIITESSCQCLRRGEGTGRRTAHHLSA
jgi:hypothetical protein